MQSVHNSLANILISTTHFNSLHFVLKGHKMYRQKLKSAHLASRTAYNSVLTKYTLCIISHMNIEYALSTVHTVLLCIYCFVGAITYLNVKNLCCICVKHIITDPIQNARNGRDVSEESLYIVAHDAYRHPHPTHDSFSIIACVKRGVKPQITRLSKIFCYSGLGFYITISMAFVL